MIKFDGHGEWHGFKRGQRVSLCLNSRILQAGVNARWVDAGTWPVYRDYPFNERITLDFGTLVISGRPSEVVNLLYQLDEAVTRRDADCDRCLDTGKVVIPNTGLGGAATRNYPCSCKGG